MKTAICYYSRHHGNTRKVLEAMAAGSEVDLIDVTDCQDIPWETYACIGFASGIYAFDVHPSVVDVFRQHLPSGTPVFFVYTYGGAKGRGAGQLEAAAREKGCPVLGEFSCKGYDTFGPFRLIGGIAKGHPNERDLAHARSFFQEVQTRLR